MSGALALLTGAHPSAAAPPPRAAPAHATTISGAPAPAPDNVPGRWTLVLDSEFRGNAVDRSIWAGTCLPWGACTNNQQWSPNPPSFREQELYRAGNCLVRHGELDLVATATGNPHHPYFSCQVTSASPHSGLGPFYFTYGLVQTKMWPASGPDTWAALWTAATNEKWPPELDVVETYGDEKHPAIHDDTVAVHYHAPGKTAVQACGGHVPNSAGIAHHWHVFAMDWEPNQIRWYLDGKKVWQCTGVAVPRATKQYLILDMALDLFIAHPPITTRNPTAVRGGAYMTRVQYVRVYQHPGVGSWGGTLKTPPPPSSTSTSTSSTSTSTTSTTSTTPATTSSTTTTPAASSTTTPAP